MNLASNFQYVQDTSTEKVDYYSNIYLENFVINIHESQNAENLTTDFKKYEYLKQPPSPNIPEKKSKPKTPKFSDPNEYSFLITQNGQLQLTINPPRELKNNYDASFQIILDQLLGG